MYTPLQQESVDWKNMSVFEDHRAAALRRFAGLRMIVDFITMDSRMISKLHASYLEQLAAERGVHLLIGLGRYRTGLGEWPSHLGDAAALTPAEALIDPTNGGEFVYSLVGDGFRLYSKGQNGIDEGGKKDRKTGADDILIWPLGEDDGETEASEEPPPGADDDAGMAAE